MSQEILEDIFNRQPRGDLFHYTDQAGLLGIIENKEIWASHTQYLNDQKEYSHAISLLSELIKISKHKYSSKLEQEILEEMNEGIKGIESVNVCVCSFSEEQDSLSQWRAYSNSSAGFSIGFSGSFIKSIVDFQECYLAPCLYEENNQVELLEALIDKVVKQNIKMKGNGEYEGYPLGGSLCAYIHRYAPILKDVSFKDEKEWRIISRPLSCKSDNYDFRTGASMLVPYYKIPLIDSNDCFLLKSITVEPTPNTKQSKMSVQSFLVRQKLKDVDVNETIVPFRSW
jgi:hypothetical protein